MKKFMFMFIIKDFAQIESYSFLYFRNSGAATFKEQLFFLNENLNVYEMKNRKFWAK